MGKLIDKHFVGVEIEAEDRDKFLMSDATDKYWRVEDDGSLRNGGLELVFREPYTGDDAVVALSAAEKSLAKCSFTDRCGLHVHVDCRKLRSSETTSFVLTYLLFEAAVFPLCGEGRETSNFAVPVYTNKELQAALGEGITPQAAQHMGRHGGRYSALNLESLGRYGSLEFRAMRGTADASAILDWIEVLLSLKEFAVTRPDFADLVRRSSDRLPEELFSEVFSNDLAEKIFQACGGQFLHRLMLGARSVQYVLHCKKQAGVPDLLLSRCNFESKADQPRVTEDQWIDQLDVSPTTEERDDDEFPLFDAWIAREHGTVNAYFDADRATRELMREQYNRARSAHRVRQQTVGHFQIRIPDDLAG